MVRIIRGPVTERIRGTVDSDAIGGCVTNNEEYGVGGTSEGCRLRFRSRCGHDICGTKCDFGMICYTGTVVVLFVELFWVEGFLMPVQGARMTELTTKLGFDRSLLIHHCHEFEPNLKQLRDCT